MKLWCSVYYFVLYIYKDAERLINIWALHIIKKHGLVRHLTYAIREPGLQYVDPRHVRVQRKTQETGAILGIFQAGVYLHCTCHLQQLNKKPTKNTIRLVLTRLVVRTTIHCLLVEPASSLTADNRRCPCCHIPPYTSGPREHPPADGIGSLPTPSRPPACGSPQIWTAEMQDTNECSVHWDPSCHIPTGVGSGTMVLLRWVVYLQADIHSMLHTNCKHHYKWSVLDWAGFVDHQFLSIGQRHASGGSRHVTASRINPRG